MKFFSNEKENDTPTDPDRTQPVAVPPQRAGSPWSDAPRDETAEAAGPAGQDVAEGQVTKTTTYGPDGAVVEDSTYHGTHADRPQDPPVDIPLTGNSTDKSPEQAAVKDDGDFDSPKAVDPATGEKLDDAGSADDTAVIKDSSAEDAAVKDDGDFDSPKAVDPATDEPLKDDRTADGEEFQPTPVAAATPAAPKPGEKLLPDGDTFAERFRDIQLRFVDEPKQATAEAAELVGEAVDKLTSALKAQRDSLGGNADDTEKLRVELRAYRDIINRLTAL
ncbi:MAG: hypothetical protein SYR96_04430 [Actinomycetota bacterium]|nr:hypothetical protein [Actinomycetota bacterium]